LNLLHFGWAFAAQYGIGLIVGHWVPQDGHYPTIAYQSALGVNLMLQATALIWFSVPWLRSLAERVRHAFERPDVNSGGRVELVPAVADGSILQPSAGVDW
jgi:hypothetical protein